MAKTKQTARAVTNRQAMLYDYLIFITLPIYNSQGRVVYHRQAHLVPLRRALPAEQVEQEIQREVLRHVYSVYFQMEYTLSFDEFVQLVLRAYNQAEQGKYIEDPDLARDVQILQTMEYGLYDPSILPGIPVHRLSYQWVELGEEETKEEPTEPEEEEPMEQEQWVEVGPANEQEPAEPMEEEEQEQVMIGETTPLLYRTYL